MRGRLVAAIVHVAWAALALTPGCGGPGRSARPDLVLVVLDTVRADALSAYGNARETTPTIDALAGRGLRFTSASSASAWTVPSHASLFTGLHPARHGATQERPRLGAGPSTLAEILRGAGYATVGVSANPLVSHATGLARGFEHYADTWRGGTTEGGAPGGGAHPNVAAARRLLREVPDHRPLFLFANFMEAHEPYHPPPERVREFTGREPGDPLLRSALSRRLVDFYLGRVPEAELALLRRLYEAELAEADAAVGALLAELERAGRLEDSLVVVTSDHGESFGEHGHFRHVFHLYRSVVHVPLVIVPPASRSDLPRGVVRDDPAAGVDVFATLVRAAGIELPAPAGAAFRGRDLLAGPGDGPVFSEYYTPLQALSSVPDEARAAHPAVFERFRRRLRAVEEDGFRLLRAEPGGAELYRVADDPGEGTDLADDPAHAERAHRLGARLDRFVAETGGDRRPPPPRPDGPAGGLGTVDPATEARLRELGYLE